jgi:hypothetical protein
MRARPPTLFGPVDRPPWNLQRDLPRSTRTRQLPPSPLLAPHSGRSLTPEFHEVVEIRRLHLLPGRAAVGRQCARPAANPHPVIPHDARVSRARTGRKSRSPASAAMDLPIPGCRVAWRRGGARRPRYWDVRIAVVIGIGAAPGASAHAIEPSTKEHFSSSALQSNGHQRAPAAREGCVPKQTKFDDCFL